MTIHVSRDEPAGGGLVDARRTTLRWILSGFRFRDLLILLKRFRGYPPRGGTVETRAARGSGARPLSTENRFARGLGSGLAVIP
jgi:hypothetical protein